MSSPPSSARARPGVSFRGRTSTKWWTKLLAAGVTNALAKVVVIGDKRVLDLGIRNAGVQLGYSVVPSVDTIRRPSERPPLIDLALERKIDGICFAPLNPHNGEKGPFGDEANNWNGFFVPAKTPRPIVDRLNKEISTALLLPDIKEFLFKQGLDAAPGTPEQFARYMNAEYAKWSKVIAAAGLKPNQRWTPARVYALEAKNFENARRNAVSIGGDSEAVAAIAGGVAEAMIGIPD